MAYKGGKPASAGGVDDSLFELSVEDIFAKYTVSEIRQLVRDLQHESDKKREDLRTLVGERYRDLMDAAETIIGMRNSSNEVVDKIRLVMDGTTEATQITGRIAADSKSKGKDPYATNNEDDSQLALAAQIKLLMDIPEMMWSSVDTRDFLRATKLFLFARHIHTNLSICEDTLEDFPVIGRQWAAISQFHEAITNGCKVVMSDGNGTVEDAVNSMVALSLLTGVSRQDIFKSFMTKRQDQLKIHLKRQDQSAKNHISYTLASITTCLATVHSAFLEKGIESTLEDLSTEKTVGLLNATIASPVMDYLPTIVEDFRPKAVKSEESETLDRTKLAERCTEWLDQIHGVVTKETSQVLSHVHSIVGLSNIRKSVHDYMITASTEKMSLQQWNSTCNELLGRDLSLWEEFYRHLFRDRVEALISTQIAGSMYYIQSSLSTISSEDSNSTAEADTADLLHFMMSEKGLNDISSNSSSSTLLSLKAKAYPPIIQDMCQKFNEMLEKFIADLKDYVNREDDYNKLLEKSTASVLFPTSITSDSESVQQGEGTEPFSLDVDNDAILKFVQTTTMNSLNSLLAYVSKNASTLNPVYAGRLFQAIPEMCPCLKTSLLAPKFLVSDRTDNFMFAQVKKSDPEWQELKAKMEKESQTLFNFWVTGLVQEFEKKLILGLENSAENNLVQVPTWDSIEISEEAEDGKTVKSIIRVPQQLSLCAFEALMSYCQKALRIGPHSLPPASQLALSQEVALALAKMYKKHSVENKLTQNVALQLLFDMQFLSQGMISRERRDVAASCQEAIASLEAHIDPFDLSVFSPYISTHAKKTILRNQCLFSVLVPSDRFALLASMKSSIPSATSISTSSSMQNGHDHHEHNVMVLSKSCPRFPLLPVSSSSSSVNKIRDSTGPGRSASTLTASNLPQNHAARRSVNSSSGTRKRSRSPVARAAGSFFEAMSTSWFGGK